MNIDSAPLKSNVDNTEQAKAILTTLTNSHLGQSTTTAENKKKQQHQEELSKTPLTDANRRNVSILAAHHNYNKSFREYLDELKQACASDIYIKRTSNIKYMAKKWSNIQAYIVSFFIEIILFRPL